METDRRDYTMPQDPEYVIEEQNILDESYVERINHLRDSLHDMACDQIDFSQIHPSEVALDIVDAFIASMKPEDFEKMGFRVRNSRQPSRELSDFDLMKMILQGQKVPEEYAKDVTFLEYVRSFLSSQIDEVAWLYPKFLDLKNWKKIHEHPLRGKQTKDALMAAYEILMVDCLEYKESYIGTELERMRQKIAGLSYSDALDYMLDYLIEEEQHGGNLMYTYFRMWDFRV